MNDINASFTPPPKDERKDTLKSEIIAIVQILLSVFIFASLIFSDDDFSRVGPAGHYLRKVLLFIFGKFACYLIPFLLIISGLSLIFKCKFSKKTIGKAIAFSVIIISLCCLLSLPFTIDLNNQKAFEHGGFLGSFILTSDGLGVAYMLGYLGCTLTFAGLLIISGLIITNVLIFDIIKGIIRFAGRGTGVFEDWFENSRFGYLRTVFAGIAKKLRPGERYRKFIDDRKVNFRKDNNEPEDDMDSPVNYSSATAVIEPETDFDATRQVSPFPQNDVVPETSAYKSPIYEDEIDEDFVDETNAVDGDSLFAEDISHEYHDGIINNTHDYNEVECAKVLPYELPPISLLEQPRNNDTRMSDSELLKLSQALEKTLADFGISANVVQITQGPVVTRFELQPAPGVKINKIVNLENDIAMNLQAQHVRIIAPIPGKGVVGIEVPKKKPSHVCLREILMSETMKETNAPLAFALGKDIAGAPSVVDLAAMPHLLIAGATGAGKSVCLNSIIMSILYRMTPEQVKFIMIDPKRVELSVYQDIPHLLSPVVCEPRKAASALAWAIEQMEDRYKRLLEVGTRNITGYNKIVDGQMTTQRAKGKKLEYMPHIVIVVDELADLMIVAKNDVEEYIIRLAQLSRAVGMHLIIATQRPSVNVITGIIKANFPTRIAFQVSSKVDSRTILDSNGAESLLGRGDMLFAKAGMMKPMRVQGAFVSDEEVEKTVAFILNQRRAQYVKEDFAVKIVKEEQLTFDDELGLEVPSMPQRQSHSASPSDEYFDDEELAYNAAKLILEYKKASVSLIQRRLKIGFARAGRLMDIMEEKGIVGPYQGSKPREFAVDPEDYLQMIKELGRLPE